MTTYEHARINLATAGDVARIIGVLGFGDEADLAIQKELEKGQGVLPALNLAGARGWRAVSSQTDRSEKDHVVSIEVLLVRSSDDIPDPPEERRRGLIA